MLYFAKREALVSLSLSLFLAKPSVSAIRSPHVMLFYGVLLRPRLSLVVEFCSKGSLFDVLNDGRERHARHLEMRMIENHSSKLTLRP